ncbi:MAG: hypothetical protein IJQ16_01395 [Selenomonadaceae bacterium]|nr:hypothetical protein [Selenomonadaceae bacterium]
MFGKFRELKNLLTETFSGGQGTVEFELKKTDFGKIHCETALIERIAGRSAKRIKGIHSAKATVDSPKGNAPLKVKFTLVIKQNYSANEVSENLSVEVRKDLEEMCGIVNAMVDVRITDVEKVERKRRVK